LYVIFGPILWGHSGPLSRVVVVVVIVVVVVVMDIDAHVRKERHLVNGRAAARSGEWAQHFSNAFVILFMMRAKRTTCARQNSLD